MANFLQNFIMSNPKRAVWFMTSMPASFWEKKGQKMALQTFREAVEKVPAYKDFLKQNGVDPSTIKTLKDFQEKVPITDKDNYLRKYSLEQLCQGEIKKETFGFCFTSGSTGAPVGMPSAKNSIDSVTKAVIGFFDYLWDIREDNRYSLCINALALGPWLGSFLSNYVLGKEAEKYNLTLVTTGSDTKMIIDVLLRIGHNYDQIIICGYASVLKSLFEEAEKRNLDFQNFDLKIISSGEHISDNLREYILNIIDPERKSPWKILDFFATTDSSVLGFSTPLTILVKELLNKNEELCLKTFNTKKIYSLFQFNSLSVFIEEKDGKLTITKPGIVPIIRYQIGDLGKVVSFETVEKVLKENGYDMNQLLKEAGWHKGYFKWPFFTFLGRADDMLTIYSGAKVYPSHLFSLLGRPDTQEIRSFKMTTQTDENQNIRLVVYLELKPDLRFTEEEIKKLEEKYQKLVHEELSKNNYDYKDAYQLNPEIVLPIIKIFHYREGPFSEDQKRLKEKIVLQ